MVTTTVPDTVIIIIVIIEHNFAALGHGYFYVCGKKRILLLGRKLLSKVESWRSKLLYSVTRRFDARLSQMFLQLSELISLL
jgi:hypothetical protein